MPVAATGPGNTALKHALAMFLAGNFTDRGIPSLGADMSNELGPSDGANHTQRRKYFKVSKNNKNGNRLHVVEEDYTGTGTPVGTVTTVSSVAEALRIINPGGRWLTRTIELTMTTPGSSKFITLYSNMYSKSALQRNKRSAAALRIQTAFRGRQGRQALDARRNEMYRPGGPGAVAAIQRLYSAARR